MINGGFSLNLSFVHVLWRCLLFHDLNCISLKQELENLLSDAPVFKTNYSGMQKHLVPEASVLCENRTGK